MTERRYPLLAREGWAHVAIVFVATVAVHYAAGWAWAAPFWLATLFVVQFFRDPTRAIPQAPGAVICPADGKVIALGEAEDPYLKRPAKAHQHFHERVQCAFQPLARQRRNQAALVPPGSFLNAALDKASRENERNALWIRTDDGEDVVVVQVAGLIARRILCYVAPGQHVVGGERYGFIRFGSRVDVYLPTASRFEVALGDKVRGGAEIIAQLTR